MQARQVLLLAGIAFSGGLAAMGCGSSSGHGGGGGSGSGGSTGQVRPLSISLSPSSVAADGSSTSTITVTALDSTGRGIEGEQVTLTASGAGDYLVQPGLTDANGVARGTIASTVPGHQTITATAPEYDGFSGTTTTSSGTNSTTATTNTGPSTNTSGVGNSGASSGLSGINNGTSNTGTGVNGTSGTTTGTNGYSAYNNSTNTDGTGVVSSGTVTATATILFTSLQVNTNGGAPAAMQAVSGNDQAALYGTTLAQPFIVRVVDADGNPVQNVTVNWATVTTNQSTQGTTGGSIAPTIMTTDANGEASTTLTLGNTPGTYTVTATAYELNPPSNTTPTTVGTLQNPDPTTSQTNNGSEYLLNGAPVTFTATATGTNP